MDGCIALEKASHGSTVPVVGITLLSLVYRTGSTCSTRESTCQPDDDFCNRPHASRGQSPECVTAKSSSYCEEQETAPPTPFKEGVSVSPKPKGAA